MSYDLLFKRSKTLKPLTAKQTDALVASLRKIAPGLKPFKFDFPAIAKSLKISLAQARKQFSHVELNDNKTGIQMMITAKVAEITIPYSLSPRKAKQTFKTIGKIGSQLVAAGFVCKDPQLGKKIDFAKDVAAMIDAYTSANKGIDELGDDDLIAMLQDALSAKPTKSK